MHHREELWLWGPAFAGTTSEFAAVPRSSLRGLGGLAEHPCRRRESATRAVGDLDLIFPGQAIGAGDHVLHEGVGAVHRAAFHPDIAAMTELVDFVHHTPVDPRLAHQIGTLLGCDDLVGAAGCAVRDDGAV